MGGDLAPKLGGTKKIFRGPRFLNDVFFGKNFHFQGQNFFFFSHRPGFWDFPFLFQHFPYVYYVKCPISPFPHQKKHIFLLDSYFHAHPTTLLLKILGGPMHGPSPHLKLWGDRPPSPPRSPPLVETDVQIASDDVRH